MKLRELISTEYAVEVDGEVHWFMSYLNAWHFAYKHKTDVTEKFEYANGDKDYLNIRTGERKTF